MATPDIFQVPLTSDVEFIILASDGLWDYMKRFFLLSLFPHLVIYFVREKYRAYGDRCFADAAQMWLVS